MYFKFSIFLLLLVNASARSANWYFPGYDIATVTTIKPSNPDTTNIRFNPEAKRISQQKCEDYKKLTYEERNMMGSMQKHRTYNCEIPIGLISGGTEAKENEFPHMANIGYEVNGEKKYVCGGTLISDKFVLTAAHCKRAEQIPVSFVRLNAISKDSRGAIFRSIESFKRHENYKTSKKYDVALIKLDRSVQYEINSKKLRPACLWSENEMNNKTATITGWGATSFAESDGSDKLLKAKIDVVEIETCKNALGGIVDEEFHFCATDLESKGRDTCQGDSGSPIQILQPDNPCQMHIIGVTSQGSPCGMKKSFGIYVKVSRVIDWIENIVWNEST